MSAWEDFVEEGLHRMVCPWCHAPLTAGNTIRLDVTDPPNAPPWDRAPMDSPRVFQLQCVECTIERGLYVDGGTP